MKKLFVTIAIMVSFATLLVNAGQTNQTAQVTKETMSKGFSPFRPTMEELNNGVEYYDGGVYRFSVTGGDFDSIKRDFGQMLASFKKNHPKLVLETVVVTDTKPRVPGASYDSGQIATRYVLSFREKE